MSRRGLMFGMLAILLGSSATTIALGQNCACSACGDSVECVKVCKLKCIDKEVEFTCWKSEFEDICVPHRSQRCGKDCVTACECQEGADGNGRKLIFGIWQPCGADVKTRRSLMKKTVVKKIPSYVWELEPRCHACCHNCISANQAMPEGIPQPPKGASLIDVSEAESVFRAAANFDAVRVERVDRLSRVSGEIVNPTIVRALDVLNDETGKR